MPVPFILELNAQKKIIPIYDDARSIDNDNSLLRHRPSKHSVYKQNFKQPSETNSKLL